MADLSEVQAGLTVKVAGAGPATGVENNYQDVDTGGNAFVSPISRNIALAGTAAALNADAVASIDLNGYQTASVQITGTWVGTLTFQGSNDNTNFLSITAFDVTSSSKSPTNTTTANGIFFIPLQFRYLRIRMTLYTSGTATATGVADTLPTTAAQSAGSDILDTGGVDTVLNLTTAASLGIVGAAAKVGRKYYVMEALATNVKWGFTNTTQNFDLFKSQIIMIPVGPNTQIWFKMSTGTGTVAIGEL